MNITEPRSYQPSRKNSEKDLTLIDGQSDKNPYLKKTQETNRSRVQIPRKSILEYNVTLIQNLVRHFCDSENEDRLNKVLEYINLPTLEAMYDESPTFVEAGSSSYLKQEKIFEVKLTKNDYQLLLASGSHNHLDFESVLGMAVVGSKKDFTYQHTGLPAQKSISPQGLVAQMSFYRDLLAYRGFPNRFKDKSEFMSFQNDIHKEMKRLKIPFDRIFIMGSSLRKKNPADVDILVLFNEDEFILTAVKMYALNVKKEEINIDFSQMNILEIIDFAKEVDKDRSKKKFNINARVFKEIILSKRMTWTSVNPEIRSAIHYLSTKYCDIDIVFQSNSPEVMRTVLKPVMEIESR